MFLSQKIGGVMKVALVITALLLGPGLLFGGTTGKIRGKVTFKDTHEGAAGAIVVLEGTPYGVAADPDGSFIILNIPAGVYTVKASLVGYHAPSVTNVRVNPDLTTELNVERVPGPRTDRCLRPAAGGCPAGQQHLYPGRQGRRGRILRRGRQRQERHERQERGAPHPRGGRRSPDPGGRVQRRIRRSKCGDHPSAAPVGNGGD